MWLRVDRTVLGSLRVSGLGERQLASFQEVDQGFWQLGGEVVLDTRLDPLLARNAVYSRAAWERLLFDDQPDMNHVVLEVAGYAGIIGQSVIVARALREDASGSLPLYLRPLLGGMDNLRGFAAGSANGDALVSGSLELRTPLSSPLNFAKLGVSAFVDAGAAYAEGERLADQAIKVGYGGSVWLSAAFIRLSVAVGHGVNESTRVHVATTVKF
jgi:outer membrane protein assembly factor BamA